MSLLETATFRLCKERDDGSPVTAVESDRALAEGRRAGVPRQTAECSAPRQELHWRGHALCFRVDRNCNGR